MIAAILAGAFATGARADNPGLPPPPVHQVIDSNGVNLTNGRATVAGPSISIGQPGKSGLAYSVSWQGRGWESNFVSSISYSNTAVDEYTVTLMGKSYSFQLVGTTFNCKDGMGETLVLSGSNYTFTARDGTVAAFDASHTFSYALITTVGLLSSVTYPSGEVLTFTQDVYSSFSYNLLSVNSSLGYQIKLLYNSSHLLTQVVAINNAVDYCAPTATSCSFSQSWPTLNFTYPGAANAITDSNGNTTTGIFRVVGTTLEARVTFPTGRYLSYLDTDGDLYTDTVTDGTSTWQYSYSISSSVVTQVTDPLSHVRLVTTDANSGVMLTDQLDPGGINARTDYSYDSFSRLTQITYKKGNAIQFTYDGRGNITHETQISSTPGTPANIVTTASFPSTCPNPLTCNKPTSITDANGKTTSYIYSSANGALLTEASPPLPGGNAQTNYTYTALTAWYKNSSGSIVAAPTSVYMLTQVSRCLLPGGIWNSASTSANPAVWGGFVWSSSGNCGGTSEENLTTYAYPSGSSSLATNLLPSSVTTGAGDSSISATVSTTYDTIGNTASVTGPLSGSTTVFFYDANRNEIGIVGPDPDGGGSLANPATKVSYNADGQVLETDQGTAPSQSRYDFDNNFTSLAQIVNGYSSVTGAKTGAASALGGTIQSIMQYGFDAARNPLCTAVRQTASLFGSLSSPFSSLPDACTQSTTSNTDLISHNDYDAANRLSATENAYGTGSPITVITNSYTSNSKIASVQDANGNQSAYTYDGLDRLVQLNFPDPSARTPSSTDYETYGYDGNGNLTSQRLRSGETASYSYDALNRQISKSFSSGSTASVYTGYDFLGHILSAHNGNPGGSGMDYTWDALGRKTSETSYGREVSSQYDLAGNRTRLTYPDGNYIQYTYDVLNRMQQVQQNGSTVMVQYAYDNLGRVSKISRNTNPGTTDYSYNNASQDWSLAQNSITPSVIFGMSYSPAGQVTQRSINNSAYAYSAPSLTQSYSPNGLNQYASVGGTNYSYDGRGNLTCVSTGAACTGTVSRNYSYDLENRLTAESASSTTIGYDPLGRMHQTTASSTTEQYLYDGNNLVVEYDGSGNILRRYVPGPGDDQPLVWYEGSGLSSPNWLHTDQQGSIVATSNIVGTATTYSYDPNGNPANWGSAPATPIFRYTGQAALAAAKLYYYKARMYDPAIGRFLQTDPVGYEAGLNLYAYVSNDPVNQVDPGGYEAAGCGYVTIDANGFETAHTSACPSSTTVPVIPGQTPVPSSDLTANTPPPPPYKPGTNYLRPTDETPSDDDDGHERARKADFNKCRGLMGAALRSACYQSARDRDYARRNGKPLRPLITQLFSPLPQGLSASKPSIILGVGGAGAAAACVVLEPCGAAVGSALGLTGFGILILQ